MKLYDTMQRSLVDVVPLDGDRVRMYTCGPTVYNYAHIGNYRAYVFEDLLRRHLKFSGFDVVQVMNLTDVDDKTISGAREAGVPLRDFTKTFKDAFFSDLQKLNIEAAEHYPAATDHVPEMIDLVSRLMESGHAYKSDDGSVYFKVSAFADYGKLAHLDMDGLKSGARVGQDEYDKETAGDFALWKAWDEDDGDVAWDAPWGRGRPGWHIECSAMSMKYLGQSFDIHTGGVDNVFPHHENEIAQSESATGEPLSKYWAHCEYLVVDGKKMSKSLGNFYTLRDLLDKGYTGREVRYVLVSAHYRQSLNFTFPALDGARASLERIDEFRSRLQGVAAGAPAGEAPSWAAKGKSLFVAAMDEDLNTARALAAIFGIVHEGNKAMDSESLDGAGAAATLLLLDELDAVLGVLAAEEVAVSDDVMTMVEARQQARETKDWAESDRLRDEIAAAGWDVKDTPDGPQLRKK